MALQAPEQVSLSVHPLMRLFGFLFCPMVYLLNQTPFALMRLLGIRDPGKASTLYRSRTLEIAADEVAASGQFDEAQRILVENIFEMEVRTAEELMTSRSRMQAIALSKPVSDVAALIATSSASRYPMYSLSLDDVGGRPERQGLHSGAGAQASSIVCPCSPDPYRGSRRHRPLNCSPSSRSGARMRLWSSINTAGAWLCHAGRSCRGSYRRRRTGRFRLDPQNPRRQLLAGRRSGADGAR